MDEKQDNKGFWNRYAKLCGFAIELAGNPRFLDIRSDIFLLPYKV